MTLKQKYETLSNREQYFVTACAIFLIAILLWLAVLKPSFDYYSNGRDSANQTAELIEWIDQNQPRFAQISQSAKNNESADDLNLLQLVSQSAEAESIQASRIEPTFDGLVRSTYTEVEFPKFLNFIQRLESQNISIESLNIDKANAPGFVNASILVSG